MSIELWVSSCEFIGGAVCFLMMSDKVLLIDTCGEGSAVGLALGSAVVSVRELPGRTASAEIVVAVRELLAGAGWKLSELEKVGVVSGPGSFTGVRAGLAAAKGFCEASALGLVAVSRLHVLAEAAGIDDGFAVLFAGRGELYALDVASGREWLCGADELLAASAGKAIVAAEQRVLEMVPGASLRVLGVGDCLPLVLRGTAVDAALVDGNYVRSESDIYKKA